MSPPNEIHVFLCDDMDEAPQVQKQLDAWSDGRPRLRIVGQAGTLDDAKDHLFDLEHFPDLVLIDDRLGRGGDATPQPSAIELAAFIWDRRYRDGLGPETRCVLWTGIDDTQLFWTFRVCGGRHVISKTMTLWPARVQRLYDVMDGAEWWPSMPALRLQPNQRDVLRYFAEGMDRAEIATRLRLDVDQVTSRVSELRRTIMAQVGAQFVPTGEVALATILREAGWVWVRPQHDHLLPLSRPLPYILDPSMIPRD